jgi:hypothetical protein
LTGALAMRAGNTLTGRKGSDAALVLDHPHGLTWSKRRF